MIALSLPMAMAFPIEAQEIPPALRASAELLELEYPALEEAWLEEEPVDDGLLFEVGDALIDFGQAGREVIPGDVDLVEAFEVVLELIGLRESDSQWHVLPDGTRAEWAEIDVHVADCLVSLREYDRAMAALETAEARYGTESGYRPILLVNLAAHLREVGRRREAVERLHEAIDLCADARPDDDTRYYARFLAHHELSYLYTHLGMPDVAEPWQLEAERLAEAGTFRRHQQGQALFHRMALSLARREPTAVLESFREAEASGLLKELRGQPMEHQLQSRRAVALAWLESSEAAPESSPDPATLLEAAIRHGPEPQFPTLQLAELWLSRGDPGRALQLLHTLESVDRDSSSARYADIHRDTLAATCQLRLGEELEPVLVRAERAAQRFFEHWRRVPARDGGVAPLHDRGYRRAFSRLLELRMAAQPGEAGVRHAFDLVLELQALGSLARHVEAAPVTLDGFRRRKLGENEGVIVLILAEPHSHLFWFDHHRIEHHRLADTSAIREARSEALESMLLHTRSPKPRWSRRFWNACDRLGEAVLSPAVAESLPQWRELTVVSDAGWIPFGALPLPSGERLGTGRAIAHLPSLPVGVWLAERRRGRESREQLDYRLLVADAPDADATPTPAELLWDEGERRELIAIFRERRARRVDQARARELLDAAPEGADTRRAQLLHVVAHGVFDLHRERAAGILFGAEAGQPSVVHGEQIEDSSHPLDPMVLLSVCGADRAVLRRGDDGRIGLPASFLAAGSDTVCASYSDLEVGRDLDHCGRLIRAIAGGSSPAEALTSLRASHDDPEDLGPYLLRVIGLGHQPVFADPVAAPVAVAEEVGLSRSSAPWLWPGIVVLVLVSALALLRARARRPAA